MKTVMKISDAMKLANKAHELATRRRYYKEVIQIHSFSESFGFRTTLEEKIIFNKNTGSVKYSAHFSGINRQTLPVVDIE